jgi:hypothetical protein
MASDLNIFDCSDWEREMGVARGTRLGPSVGARRLGCSLYEIDPLARPCGITRITQTRNC